MIKQNYCYMLTLYSKMKRCIISESVLVSTVMYDPKSSGLSSEAQHMALQYSWFYIRQSNII